ncbi:MAG: hypothetical protein AAF632_16945 [Bacteroidota bacterium]
MLNFTSAASKVIVLAGCWLLGSCHSDDTAEPTLERQLARTRQLNTLNTSVELDGLDYKVFLAQFADLLELELAPEEVAIGLLLLEARITQELLNREPALNLQPDQFFEFWQINDAPLVGSWHLSEDEQQLTLTSEANEVLSLLIKSVDEGEMMLLIEDGATALFNLPQFPQQLSIQMEMSWLARESSIDE